jgi:hypothetical protein
VHHERWSTVACCCQVFDSLIQSLIFVLTNDNYDILYETSLWYVHDLGTRVNSIYRTAGFDGQGCRLPSVMHS